MRRSHSLRAFGAVWLLAAAILTFGGCGDDAARSAGDDSGARTEGSAAVGSAREVSPTPSAEELAAEARGAARKKRAASARRAERRDQERGSQLLQGLIDAGTRDQWSVMGIRAEGGDVSVSTDLAPGSAGFTGACEALKARQPWIVTIAVRGTDGLAHATWAKGDAACTAS